MGLKQFHISTVEELIAVKDRVRNLINHWGEEGSYKEAVLKSIIQRFLPEKFKIGTGFVVKQTPDRGPHRSSKQIDLIIYDTSYPVLFREGDFVILTPDAVFSIIEVKANMENRRLIDILNKSNENGHFIFSEKRNKIEPFFNGIFSFDGYENGLNHENIRRDILESQSAFQDDRYFDRFTVNHIAFNKNLLYRFSTENAEKNSIYQIEDLAFAYFVSNIMDVVSGSVIDNRYVWFPVDKEFDLICRF